MKITRRARRSVTSGIISATGRVVAEPASDGKAGATLPDAIQTSAPINPGNSGGALVTTAGDQITLSVLRGAQELPVKLTLGELPGN